MGNIITDIHDIKILLVEDEKEELSLKDSLKEFSSWVNTELFVFEGEKKLIDFLNEHRNDKRPTDSYCTIIFFNCHDELCTGIDTIKKIKSDASFKTIPIFVISPSIDRKGIKEVYSSYANAYIVKPEDLKGLMDILDRFKNFWNLAQLPK
jgi:response regulator RpfG family c-di-GMP phosphodiesterase